MCSCKQKSLPNALGPRHTKKRRVVCMLFFEVLLFSDTASVVYGKTSKKSMQKKRGVFLVCQDPYTEFHNIGVGNVTRLNWFAGIYESCLHVHMCFLGYVR